MNILYETIIESIQHRFRLISELPVQQQEYLEGYRQSALLIHSRATLAITAEMCMGPVDWVTVIRFFSAIHSGDKTAYRINQSISNERFQFAWDKAKTYIITKIDNSGNFSLSLTEKPFVMEPSVMLARSEVVNTLIAAAAESTFGRDG